jgi:hypothetical protein
MRLAAAKTRRAMLQASGRLLLGSTLLGHTGLAACATAAAPPRRLRRPHPLIALTSEPGQSAAWVDDTLPDALARLHGWHLELRERVELRLYADERAFAAGTGRREPWLRAWTGYATVHLLPPPTWSDASRVAQVERLAHELTHAAVFQGLGAEGVAARVRAPLWFNEGTSSLVAGQGARRMPLPVVVVRAGAEDPLVGASAWMRRDHHVAYGAAHHVMAALAEGWGRDLLARVLAAARVDGTEGAIQRALAAATGLEERGLWPWLKGAATAPRPAGA